MAKITYTDKVSTEVDPTIPEINKITDANMNEIKSVVNDNYDYSIYIGDEADATSDTKLLIETDTLASLGTEITNTYSTSQVLGYSANYVNTLNTYSTTEQKIGTWTDGKPIYRKVAVYNNIGISSSVTLQTNIANGDEVVKFCGEFIDTSSGATMPYPTLNSAGTSFLQCLISNDASTIYFRGTDSWGANTTRTHKFIIEYTKTTD